VLSYCTLSSLPGQRDIYAAINSDLLYFYSSTTWAGPDKYATSGNCTKMRPRCLFRSSSISPVTWLNISLSRCRHPMILSYTMGTKIGQLGLMRLHRSALVQVVQNKWICFGMRKGRGISILYGTLGHAVWMEFPLSILFLSPKTNPVSSNTKHSQ
jgi:hypothetical protein